LANASQHSQFTEIVAKQFEHPGVFLNRIREIYREAPPETFDVLKLRDGRTIERSSRIQSIGERNVGRVWSFRDISDRARVEQEMQAERQALELLNRTGISIAAKLDLRSLVQTVTDAATTLSGAKFGAFFFTVEDREQGVLTLYTLSGAPRAAFENLGHPRGTDLFGPTFHGEAPIRSDDILEDPRYGKWAPHYGMPEGHLPVRSYLAAPVVSRAGDVLGGLFFGHPEPGVFNERAERIVCGIAAQAAIAIDNARLYEAAQKEITTRINVEDKLKDADRRKDEFLAVLAHELRNPLAPILQAARVLKSENAAHEEVRWSHDVIDRQVRQMSLLLDDLLDISRITRGQLKLRRKWTDLASVIDLALESAGPAISARHHELTIELPDESIRLDADPLRLSQILANLVTNAAKYTQPRGSIRIRAEQNVDTVVMQVIDSGIGIDPEVLPHLFKMFARTKSAGDYAEGGLGIGLALVKGLVELHGGKVEAASGAGMPGSVFTVRLPVGQPPAQERSPAGRRDRDSGPGHPRRILVVDDNRDSADSLAMVLRLRGHDVSVGYNGESAVSLFESLGPEFVILDIGMPIMDGYEAARRIRAAATGNPPVILIALTGWGQQSDKRAATAAGFDHHFTKPVETERLLELL
jgi:signal transduction histidine kinase